jgi:periplasmic copper chaperone A
VPRTPLRLLTVAGIAAATVGLTALPALAHVTVSSPGATQGSYGVITFRVPTESDTASTTGLKVQLPADTPLLSVSVKPKAGWTYTVTRAKLPTPVDSHGEQVTDYPAVVEWKIAAGDPGIKPGEFDEFQVSGGPMPKADSITFKAIQTYSDGEVVSWIDEAAEGSTEEPDKPAPVLELAAADATDADAAPASTGTAATATFTDDDAASKGSVTGAYVLGGIGLLAGLAALALTVTRRRTTS